MFKSIFRKIELIILVFLAIVSIPSYAYRVFPSSGPSRTTLQGIMDNSGFPFVAQNADGIYIQPAGWTRISTTERNKLINQFTNKNVSIEDIFKGQNISTSFGVTSLPSSVHINNFMLYSDGGAMPMDAIAITKIVSQKPPMPIIINCRNFTGNNNNIQSVLNNDSIQGMCYEVGATKDVVKIADIVAGIKYALDRNKLFLMLIPNSGSVAYNVAAIKFMYSYIKSNLAAQYLNSDNLIFAPANYNFDTDFFFAPETEGSNTLSEVSKWLIEQKNAILVPQITFTSPADGARFDNHKNLTVSLTVTHSVAISNVELFVDNVSLGKKTNAPYSWNNGILTNLVSGIHDIKAVATDINGVKGDNIVEIKVLKDPLPIPGKILAGDVYSYTLTANASIKEFYVNNEYRGDVLNYTINVAKTGSYKIKFGIFVDPAKNYGGDILLYNARGSLLGSVASPYNDPANRNPLVVANPYPDMILSNIFLSAGVQTLTLKFNHLNEPQVMFSFMDIDFQLQNSPTITFSSPVEKTVVFQNYDPTKTYLTSTPITIALDALAASGSTISKVDLLVDDVLIRSINSAPFIWNNIGQDVALSSLTVGTHTIKAIATDNAGLYSVKSVQIEVMDHTPFTNNNVPGTIEAENYDLGGEGVGYHDLSTTLTGIDYRWEASNSPREMVGITEYITGNYAVGWTVTGEWLEHTINVQSTGKYNFSYYCSASTSDKTFSASLDGTGIGSKIIKNKGLTVYDSVTIANVNLTKGVHTLRFNVTNGGFNFDKIVISQSGQTALNTIETNPDFQVYPNPAKDQIQFRLNNIDTCPLKIYNSIGKLVYENDHIVNNFSVSTHEIGEAGIYFVNANGKNQKLIIIQ